MRVTFSDSEESDPDTVQVIEHTLESLFPFLSPRVLGVLSKAINAIARFFTRLGKK